MSTQLIGMMCRLATQNKVQFTLLFILNKVIYIYLPSK